MRNILSDVFERAPLAEQLFERRFNVRPDRQAVTMEAAKRKIAPAVLAELKNQNVSPQPAAEQSLATLERGDTAVVVTGQQLGVLGGPVFTLYKIASAVRVARELASETGLDVVPIFWLQSEDHDFDEIKRARFILENGSERSIELPSSLPGVGDSVGRVRIPIGFSDQFRQLLDTAIPNPDTDALRIFERAYRDGATLAEAMSYLIRALFGSLGVLVFNPDSAPIKRELTPLFKRAFTEAAQIETRLAAWNLHLSQNDYPIQVPLKERSPLPFVSLNGLRQRLTGDSTHGYVSPRGEEISNAALLSLMESEPTRLTPSALLRPVMQDFLFPNAAYICGAVEFNYLVQTRPLYDFFGVTRPLVIPRASFALLGPKHALQLRENRLLLADLLGEKGAFLKSLHAGTTLDPDTVFEPARREISSMMESLATKLEQVDPQLRGPISTTRDSILHNLGKLEGKYVRSLESRDAVAMARFDRLKAICLPGGEPQERVMCGAQLALRAGADIVETIVAAIQPFGPFDTNILEVDI